MTIHSRETQPPWRGSETLRFPLYHVVARAAPRRRARWLHPAWMAAIDEGLNLGCAASSAAPSTHGAPDQLGAIDASHRDAKSRAREALWRLACRTSPPQMPRMRFGAPGGPYSHVPSEKCRHRINPACSIPVNSPRELSHILGKSKVYAINLFFFAVFLCEAKSKNDAFWMRSTG